MLLYYASMVASIRDGKSLTYRISALSTQPKTEIPNHKGPPPADFWSRKYPLLSHMLNQSQADLHVTLTFHYGTSTYNWLTLCHFPVMSQYTITCSSDISNCSWIWLTVENHSTLSLKDILSVRIQQDPAVLQRRGLVSKVGNRYDGTCGLGVGLWLVKRQTRIAW